ncbi:MAG: protease inhibitor I42 family protein [Elusimicrobiota bacterium]
MRRSVAGLALLAGGLLLGGCAGAGTRKASLGERFSVSLESNPTTGYGWRLARPLDGTVLELVDSGYEDPPPGLVGRGGREIWTFKAVGRGRATIELEYTRPWEKGKPPVRRELVPVKVR